MKNDIEKKPRSYGELVKKIPDENEALMLKTLK